MTAESPNTNTEMAEQTEVRSVPIFFHPYETLEHEKDADPKASTSRLADRKYLVNFKSDPEMSLTAFGIAWPGVVLAAGCYPVVLAVTWGFWSLLSTGFDGLRFTEVGLVVCLSIISIVFGLISGAIMSVPAFLLTQALCWSLNGIVSTRGAIGIFGGMTGFLVISGGGFYFNDALMSDLSWEMYAVQVLVVLLAIALGYLGAILAGYLCRFDGFPFFEPFTNSNKKITISFLLKLTVVVAVLAIIFKATHGLSPYIGIAWLVYLLAQTVLLVCDRWITTWLGRRARFSKL